jgi:hypothetical protein
MILKSTRPAVVSGKASQIIREKHGSANTDFPAIPQAFSDSNSLAVLGHAQQ